ncbi:MAG: chemotaxis protein CheW [Magnetococcales bacterium]|nr:chemotaxis protein CheW [Magnetococcales bacterium]
MNHTSDSRETVHKNDPTTRLPASKRDREVLQQRAKALAGGDLPKQERAQGELFLLVRLGPREHYGIPYRFTDEIISPVGLAAVPCSPGFIAGVINRRGELLTVVELKHFFGQDHLEMGPQARIVVVHAGEITAGVLVDEVIGNDRYLAGQLTPPLNPNGGAGKGVVEGIHKGRIAILDLEPLFASQTLAVRHEKGK